MQIITPKRKLRQLLEETDPVLNCRRVIACVFVSLAAFVSHGMLQKFEVAKQAVEISSVLQTAGCRGDDQVFDSVSAPLVSQKFFKSIRLYTFQCSAAAQAHILIACSGQASELLSGQQENACTLASRPEV